MSVRSARPPLVLAALLGLVACAPADSAPGDLDGTGAKGDDVEAPNPAVRVEERSFPMSRHYAGRDMHAAACEALGRFGIADAETDCPDFRYSVVRLYLSTFLHRVDGTPHVLAQDVDATAPDGRTWELTLERVAHVPMDVLAPTMRLQDLVDPRHFGWAFRPRLGGQGSLLSRIAARCESEPGGDACTGLEERHLEAVETTAVPHACRDAAAREASRQEDLLREEYAGSGGVEAWVTVAPQSDRVVDGVEPPGTAGWRVPLEGQARNDDEHGSYGYGVYCTPDGLVVATTRHQT